MRIKIFENFNGEIDDTIERINKLADYRDYDPQLRITEPKYFGEFITLLWEISEYRMIDALGGTESRSFRRYDISDKVEFSDIIHMAPTGLVAGIKIIKYPVSRLMEWDLWPGGYIEGLIRMRSDDPRFGEYFIWCYIKPEKLRYILEKFGDKLELLD